MLFCRTYNVAVWDLLRPLPGGRSSFLLLWARLPHSMNYGARLLPGVGMAELARAVEARPPPPYRPQFPSLVKYSPERARGRGRGRVTRGCLHSRMHAGCARCAF